MFHDWDSFYLLIGSAAAALIGLLFVVSTLTTELDRTRATRGAKVYMTPTVFHFAVVVVISGMALTPELPEHAVALVVGVPALAGLAYAGVIGVRIGRGAVVPDEEPHWSDVWYYGVAPAATYVALVATAVGVWTAVSWATYAVGWALMVLLLIGIRNAWDLVTYLAPRVKKD
jgi:hypothetical protein